MFNLVLYQPEIPPNTGNIIRLCVNTGCRLHCILPMGFSLDHKQLKRAGLDYAKHLEINTYTTLAECLAGIDHAKVYAVTTKGTRIHTSPKYHAGDTFIFGPESRGLPTDILASFEDKHKIAIPMRTNDRSLNLANAAAIMVYEAWRQLNFS